MGKYTDIDVKKIEGYWTNIEQLKRDLRFREYELLHPYQETDINVGGGRSGQVSDQTGERAIILASDKIYQNLKNIVTTIETLYPELDEDQKTIVKMRYWDKKECYEWQHVADTLYMSVQRVLRKRNNLIDETARRIGWI